VSPVGDLNAWSLLQPRAVLMTTAAIDAFRATVEKVRAAKAAAIGTDGVVRKSAARRPAAKVVKPVATKPAAAARKTAKRVAKKEK
jgi:hypothetical protein